MNPAMHWTKTPEGYALNGHRLVKSGRTWTLYTATGASFPLGPRPSFDHAEALLKG